MNESKVLQSALWRILTHSYEEIEQFDSFSVEIVGKEIKSKNAHYVPNDRKIELFNLAREPHDTMLTCLSCLATHLYFMETGETSKKEEYYTHYQRLIVSALSLGVLEADQVTTFLESSTQGEKLIKHCGPFTWWHYELTEEAKQCVVAVSNAYQEKDVLKQRGYRYHPQSELWAKAYPNRMYAVREETVLTSCLPKEKILIVKPSVLWFTLHYYIAVPSAYEAREFLKQRGYRWQAFGIKNSWVKKVVTHQYYQKEQALKDARLVFRRVTPKE